MSEAGEAAEEEDVADGIQVGLGFIIPGRLVVDLGTGLEVQPLSVERGAKPDLEKVLVFPVSPQLGS